MSPRRTDGPHVVKFVEQFLTLTGSYAGEPFIPLPWMRDYLDELYELREDGTRKIATALLGIPRKNAKSTIAAAVALYQLVVDRRDESPEIVIAAGDRDQARIIFRMASEMVARSPHLSRLLKVRAREIIHPGRNGRLTVVSRDAGLAHGMNPSTAIVDEYHVHPTEDLYVALRSGMAMRRSPLTLVITTAGWDLDSPLGRLYAYGRRVESGEVDDDSFLFRWWGPREGEVIDHLDPAVWERYNPSWKLMRPAEFKSTALQMSPNQFIRFRLNGWTATEEAWLPIGAWQALDAGYNDPLADGDEVVLGFDGSWKGDATAVVACRVRDLRVEILGLWERPEGPLGAGWHVPAGDVEAFIRQQYERFRVLDAIADPAFFRQTISSMQDDGLPVAEISTSSAKMGELSKIFFDAVIDGRLSHDGDPRLARHVANARLKSDARGSKVAKDYRSSTRYIDACIASVLAVGHAVLYREQHSAGDPQFIQL